MEEAKKYIPDNCTLVCDKGQFPTQIRVTHSNNCRLYGELFVTEADIVPNVNIPLVRHLFADAQAVLFQSLVLGQVCCGGEGERP